jgi:hypothetical protein
MCKWLLGEMPWLVDLALAGLLFWGFARGM